MEQLYGSNEDFKIYFWNRPIDIICSSSRLMTKNPETGYMPTLKYGDHVNLEHKCHYIHDKQFLK